MLCSILHSALPLCVTRRHSQHPRAHMRHATLDRYPYSANTSSAAASPHTPATEPRPGRAGGADLAAGVGLAEHVLLAEEAVRRQDGHVEDERQAAQELLQQLCIRRLRRARARVRRRQGSVAGAATLSLTLSCTARARRGTARAPTCNAAERTVQVLIQAPLSILACAPAALSAGSQRRSLASMQPRAPRNAPWHNHPSSCTPAVLCLYQVWQCVFWQDLGAGLHRRTGESCKGMRLQVRAADLQQLPEQVHRVQRGPHGVAPAALEADLLQLRRHGRDRRLRARPATSAHRQRAAVPSRARTVFRACRCDMCMPCWARRHCCARQQARIRHRTWQAPKPSPMTSNLIHK